MWTLIDKRGKHKVCGKCHRVRVKMARGGQECEECKRKRMMWPEYPEPVTMRTLRLRNAMWSK